MANYWLVPLVALGVSQVAVIATSIYLHRALAHQVLRVHPIADAILHCVILITTGQRRREWVAVHRKHHAFTDREGDPHSPRIAGFWNIQLWNVVYYVREARNPRTLQRFAPDIQDSVLDRFGGWWGPAVGVTGLVLFFGFWRGIAIGFLHAVLYVFVLAPLINALGHWRGQQNFVNTAYNSRFLAWVTGGESLHNNHHAHPRAPKFSMRRWEFDPSWGIIKMLAVVGLVKVIGRLVSLPG